MLENRKYGAERRIPCPLVLTISHAAGPSTPSSVPPRTEMLYVVSIERSLSTCEKNTPPTFSSRTSPTRVRESPVRITDAEIYKQRGKSIDRGGQAAGTQPIATL